MKLNHLNLSVSDVAAAREFLETFFNMTCEVSRGNGFALMYDDDGLALTLMKGREVHYPKTFYIGFSQKNKEQVNKINQCLRENGFDVKPPGYAHGCYTFYVDAPGGFMVEVPCYSES
ncbi:VOC family protein [Heyndrickxia vini]|uniref:VOC family protein n=1 Tax=Heyndrickxia vini TaxID=1476025 RepID=A0ABX7DZC9_9BACI|nr:VOC family protein [Heyndrickxia vini]QQZ08410.1 VOC family protein [Heyndrickxia vini]